MTTREEALEMVSLIDTAIANALSAGKVPKVSWTQGGTSCTREGLGELLKLRREYQAIADRKRGVTRVPLLRRRAR